MSICYFGIEYGGITATHWNETSVMTVKMNGKENEVCHGHNLWKSWVVSLIVGGYGAVPWSTFLRL